MLASARNALSYVAGSTIDLFGTSLKTLVINSDSRNEVMLLTCLNFSVYQLYRPTFSFHKSIYILLCLPYLDLLLQHWIGWKE